MCFKLSPWKDVQVSKDTECIWFTGENSGGYGLYASGKISSDGALSEGKLSFDAQFDRFNPNVTLNNRSFKVLDRTASESPMEKLNQLLYVHSHNKVSEIDEETYQFLKTKFQ